MNVWRKTSLGIFFFITLVIGIVFFLISTTSGIYLLLSTVGKLVTGLEIGHISGDWHDLRLKNIYYDMSGIKCAIDEFHLSINFDFLHENLYINKFLLKNTNIVIDSKKIIRSKKIKKEVGTNFVKFLKPYSITFNHIILNNVNLTKNNTTFFIKDFISGLHWKNKTVTIKPTSLQGLLIISKKIKIERQEKIAYILQKKEVLNKNIKDFFLKPILSKTNNLHLNFNIEEFKGKKIFLISNTKLSIDNILLKISSTNGNIYLNTLNIDSNFYTISTTGSIQLYDSYPINISICSILHTNSFQEEKIKLKISGALRNTLKVDMSLSGPINAILHIQTQLTMTGFPLNIEISSKQFFWPLIGRKLYQANDLRFKLYGTINNYTLLFYTLIRGNDIPSTTFVIKAKGNEQQILLDKFTILMLEGKSELTALLNWQQKISCYGKLEFYDINIEKKILKYPLKLNGLIEIKGNLDGNNWKIDIPKLQINGNIKKSQVSIAGILKGNSDLQWSIPSLFASVGNNTIVINNGKIWNDNINVSVVINAANFNNIFPNFFGRMKGIVKILGTVKHPKIESNIIINRLRWKEFSIENIYINTNTKPINQIGNILNIHAKHIITNSGINIRSAMLNISNGTQRYNMQFQIKSNLISGHVHLNGNFNRSENCWQYKLSHVYFNTPIGPWSLTRPTTLKYNNSEKKIIFSPHCWKNPNAKIYVHKIISTNLRKIHTIVNFNNFNLEMFKLFIPNTFQIKGTLNGMVDINFDKVRESFLKNNIILFGKNVKITKVANDIPLSMIFNDLKLRLYLHDKYAELNWFIRINNVSQLDGYIQMTNLQGHQKLSCNVNIRNFNLEIIRLFCFCREKVAGVLSTNLKLSGNVKSPHIMGQAQLNDVDIDGIFFPFNIQSNQLVINFTGMYATFQGKINTQQGLIDMNGNASWNHYNNWEIRITVKGIEVHTITPPILRCDFLLNMVFEKNPNSFISYIKIPWARIMMDKFPKNTIDISSDEVIFDENEKYFESKGIRIPMSNLVINIGENVFFDAFGLKAKLTGNLNILRDKTGPSLNGQINISEGKFNSYGQDLLIRKGELLFFGSPNQPLFNIEAIRNPETVEANIIAGIRITGTIDKLKIEIFSDPVVSQQETLSYLLYGRGLSKNKNDSTTITSILVGLGITKGNQIVNNIGKILGVKNMVLYAQGIGESLRIIVSGYMFPDLQMKYDVSVFDSKLTFVLRYRLIPKLYLEMITGINQTLDLLYQFEF